MKEREKLVDSKSSTDGSVYQASVFFQMLLFGVFGAFLFFLLYRPVVSFMTDDEYPELSSLTPQEVVDLGGSPTFVDVGLYIRDVSKFDLVDGEIVVDATVWFLFDPSLISIERLGKFTFHRATVISKSEPYVRIEKGKLLARYDMRFLLSLKLNYKKFPLDDHKINFTLTNHLLSPSEIIFQSSRGNLILNPEIVIHGWEDIDSTVKIGYLLDEMDPYEKTRTIYHPRVVFSLDFARVGFRSIMVIVLPLLLVFMIVLFSWTFDPFGRFATGIMSMSIMSITAVIAHHFVMERLSPKTGYLMISNYLFLLILSFCCIVFLVNVLGKRVTGFYKNVMALVLYIILVTVLIVLTGPLS
ncbi:hypothetical protein KKA53_00555 [Candidatus Dependentiae bacterium]|nr:hypothetical protein [Candidatus Dependentiae bacterium]